MHALWNSLVYLPLYNILIAFIALTPGHSVGLAIIALTIIVKTLLFPITKKAMVAQRQMRVLEPELKAIREKHGKDQQTVAKKTMELYQEKNVSPFSGCLPLLVQIPIIIGLYGLFLRGLNISPDMLYSFVPHPDALDMHFLSINLAGKSVVLAALAGATQYLQTRYMLPKGTNLKNPIMAPDPTRSPSFQEEFARSMNAQMLYVFPILIASVSYSTSAAVALYFVASNIFGIGQEFMIRREFPPSK